MTHIEPPKPPETWSQFRARTRNHWARHALIADWLCAKFAWYLGQWSLLKVLAYAETFSILVVVIFWISEAGERRQQKHYQAWQVINTAQGKGGSGGRIEALQQLNDDHVPLVGVDVSDAFLQDVQLEKAELRRATFNAADLRRAHLRLASLEDADLRFANLRGADLRQADLAGATLADADLDSATLAGAKFTAATLENADLRNADLAGIQDWQHIESIERANLAGVKNAPAGFLQWATAHGAVDIQSTDDWNALLNQAAAQNSKH